MKQQGIKEETINKCACIAQEKRLNNRYDKDVKAKLRGL